jgi:hypothetical protein
MSSSQRGKTDDEKKAGATAPVAPAAATDAKPKAAATEQRVTVRAKTRGFYDGARRREGEVFEIASGKDLGRWMERVDDGTPLSRPAVDAPKEKADGKGQDSASAGNQSVI